MNTAVEETEDDLTNVVKLGEYPNFTSIPGGQDGDWLSNMPEGTVFIAKHINQKSFLCHEFEIVNRCKNCTLLSQNSDGDSTWFWVISPLYCREFNLLGIVKSPLETL